GVGGVRRGASRKIPKSSMEIMTVHMMGTARMGADRARHVCDSYGEVYDAEGLWVADASLFPSPIGVNPMETIMALATRNAGRIIETHHSRKAAKPTSVGEGRATWERGAAERLGAPSRSEEASRQ